MTDPGKKELSRAVKVESEPGYERSSMDAEVTALMVAVKRGEDGAFDDLVTRVRNRAFLIARGLVGSKEDAMDLAQEALMKTYRARETYREGEPFLPWFHRILRNTCFSFLRKHKRLKRWSISGDKDEGESDWEILADDPAPTAQAEHDEVKLAFWEGFKLLSSRDREILTLRHFEDLSYRHIAEALDIPEGTVMSRLFHARRHLREKLAPYMRGALSDLVTTGDSASDKGGAL